MTATLRDVALEAGVSIRTVSRVVNNKSEIANTTRQRVLAAISKLDYRPNSLARSLVSGKTRSIAVVIPQITDPFYPEFVQGVESIARGQEYQVFLCNTDDDPLQEWSALEMLAGKQAEGVILCGTRLNHEQLRCANAMHNLVVVTDRPPQGIPSIHVQEEEGLAAITTHLIRLGHREIGHIARPQYGRSARLTGYQAALTADGIPVTPHNIESIAVANIENGRVATMALLQRNPALTALTCYNDLVAIGALQACKALGKRVPSDLAIVGFDDINLAALVAPALSTVRVERRKLGQMASDLLMQIMDNPSAPLVPWELPTTIVVRDSCGATIAN